MESTTATASERTLRRLVNFGIVAVARIQGVPPNQLLPLRCECGARGCQRIVEASAVEHRDDSCSIFMVAPDHRGSVSGRVVVANERFARIAELAGFATVGC